MERLLGLPPRSARAVPRARFLPAPKLWGKVRIQSESVSQSCTVPPRAHPSTGSQSGSATPGLTQVTSTRSRGLLNVVASEVNLSQRTGIRNIEVKQALNPYM